jgi:hypothetical protein
VSPFDKKKCSLTASSDLLLTSCLLRAAVNLFGTYLFVICGVAQVHGVTDAGLSPRKISKVAVLGGGLMGSGIATALVLSGVDVLLKEVNQQFLDVSVGGGGVKWGVIRWVCS